MISPGIPISRVNAARQLGRGSVALHAGGPGVAAQPASRVRGAVKVQEEDEERGSGVRARGAE